MCSPDSMECSCLSRVSANLRNSLTDTLMKANPAHLAAAG